METSHYAARRLLSCLSLALIAASGNAVESFPARCCSDEKVMKPVARVIRPLDDDPLDDDPLDDDVQQQNYFDLPSNYFD